MRKPNQLFVNFPRTRHFWYLMLNITVTGLASTMIAPYLPVFLYEKLGISIGSVSFLYFASGIVGTLSIFLIGWLVDRVGERACTHLEMRAQCWSQRRSPESPLSDRHCLSSLYRSYGVGFTVVPNDHYC